MDIMKKYLTPIIFAVVVLGVAIFAIIALRSPEKSTSATSNNTTVTGPNLVTLETGHDQGPADAKVVLTEFGDYQCPICGEYYPLLKNQILPQYSGKIRFVFKNFPLSQHQNALNAAEAAEAAGAQGNYWGMHDLLYSNQNDWATLSDPVPTIGKYAAQLGLDSNRLMSEVRAKKYASVIQSDVNFGNKLQVQGTPTFYVNGKLVDTVNNGQGALVTSLNAALGQ